MDWREVKLGMPYPSRYSDYGWRGFCRQPVPDGPFVWAWEAWRGYCRWGRGEGYESREAAVAAAKAWWCHQAGYPVTATG